MDRQTVKRLIQQSIQGDETAFRKLVELHQPFVYSVVFRIICNEFDTEEVVQETFIKVWKHLSDFRNEMRFSTWLYKIVINLCYDRLKAEKSRRKVFDRTVEYDVLYNILSENNIEKDYINQDQANIIRCLTRKLTPKQKVVFVLSELEQLSVEEITSITGLSAEKIKSNLYCARIEIRKKLAEISKIRGTYAI
ncbi:MAG TPA: RNA polymerase sigma factor [Bacteroidales bacterium]|jgi:RNA polymerase sigma-70 factor (ECF subfamily)|nr:RNA polymerase sigma factor [Bacteroidales bacterium]